MVKAKVEGNDVTPKKFASLQSFYRYLKRVPVRITAVNRFKPIKVGSGSMCFSSIPTQELTAAFESLKGKCAMQLRDAQIPELKKGMGSKARANVKKQIKDIKARRAQRMNWLYNSEAETSTFNPLTRYKPCDKTRKEYHINRVCNEMGIEDELDVINFRCFFDSNYFEFKARGRKGVVGKFQKVKRLAEIYFSCQNDKGVLNVPKLRHLLQPYLKGELLNPVDPIATIYSEAKAGTIELPKKDNLWKGTACSF